MHDVYQHAVGAGAVRGLGGAGRGVRPAHLAPDFTAAQSTDLPWGGSFAGLPGLLKMLAALRQRIVPTVTVERLIDAGEHVVAIGRTRGTTTDGGRPFDVPPAHLWHLRDGRVVLFRPYIDHPTVLAALRPATGS